MSRVSNPINQSTRLDPPPPPPHPNPPTSHSMTELVAISIGWSMYLEFDSIRIVSMKSVRSHPMPFQCFEYYSCGACAVPIACLMCVDFHRGHTHCENCVCRK